MARKERVQARTVRTVMFSVDERGRTVRHLLPFDANDRYGREKLDKFIERGFSFQPPGKEGGVRPEVLISAPPRLPRLGEQVLIKDEEVSSSVETLGAGFSEVDIKEEAVVGDTPCPECSFVARGFWGLQRHMTKHLRERGELPPAKRGKNRKSRKRV